MDSAIFKVRVRVSVLNVKLCQAHIHCNTLLLYFSCPTNDAKLLSSEDSKDVRFTFKAFDFRHNSSGFVFIHCQVSVCSSSDVTCKSGCGARAKRSAHAYQSVDSHLVSTGPLFVENPQRSTTGTFVVGIERQYFVHITRCIKTCMQNYEINWSNIKLS